MGQKEAISYEEGTFAHIFPVAMIRGVDVDAYVEIFCDECGGFPDGCKCIADVANSTSWSQWKGLPENVQAAQARYIEKYGASLPKTN